MLWAAVCVMLATGVYQIFLMLAAGLLIVYVIWYASRRDGRTGLRRHVHGRPPRRPTSVWKGG